MNKPSKLIQDLCHKSLFKSEGRKSQAKEVRFIN